MQHKKLITDTLVKWHSKLSKIVVKSILILQQKSGVSFICRLSLALVQYLTICTAIYIACCLNNLFVNSLTSYVSRLVEEIFSIKVRAKHNTDSFYASYDIYWFMLLWTNVWWIKNVIPNFMIKFFITNTDLLHALF